MNDGHKFALDIQNVSYAYPTSPEKVLESATLSVKEGSFVGIVGPNGCGKTTLVKLVTGTIPGEQGEISVFGRPLQSLDQRNIARRIGVVPQRWDVQFDYTVTELVSMGRYPYMGRFERETAQDREIVHKAMALTNILHLAERSVMQMSGGEMQRAVIAQALAQTPQILVLDEATSNLDINHQTEIMELLKKLQAEEGLTVVAIMHDLNLTAQYCQTVFMMQKGKVVASGEPRKVLTPANIRSVYGANVRVRTDPVTKHPIISLLPSTIKRDPYSLALHVIAGGGVGCALLEHLVNRGHKVSCGVVNQYDADYQFGEELGVNVISEKAFSPIGDGAHGQNVNQILGSQGVIVTDVPFGTGNLRNLQAVFEGARRGIPTVFLQTTPFDQKDYTGGKAFQVYQDILANGAILCDSLPCLGEILRDIAGAK